MSECMETHSGTATVIAIMCCITKKECDGWVVDLMDRSQFVLIFMKNLTL